MKKYSKQRETILSNLKSRIDHPTAEQLYLDLKEQMPELGIATVYRNLSELCENGQVVKIKSKTGADRFDGNNKPHIHFLCEKCEQLLDICLEEKEKNKLDNDMLALAKQIDGKVLSSEILITGICKNCN
jgi:Fur family peroxide stress response transcriptional regulator